MANKDGEASVEDILRSIKQVISREDGPRTPGSRSDDGNPITGRSGGFAPTPYSFSRHSPFGSRSTDQPPAFSEEEDGEEETEAEGRTDVFDLKSLDSDALELDEEAAHEPVAANPEPEQAPRDDIRMIVPPVLPPLAEDEDEEEPGVAPSPYGFRPAADSSEDAGESDVEDEPVVLGSDEAVEDAIEPEDEDDEPAITLEPPYAVEAGAEPEPEAIALPEPQPEPEIAPEPEAETLAEPEALAALPAEEPAEPEAEPAPALSSDEVETLIAGSAADTLRDSFAALQSVASKPTPAAPVGTANPLEDMVREMMRPMLKQWLDDNMPGLVEKIVEREIARITGRL